MSELDNKVELDWDALEVGETFDKFEYTLTQKELIYAYNILYLTNQIFVRLLRF